MNKRKRQITSKRNPHNLARLSLEPNIKGAVTVRDYSKVYGELDLTGLSNELVRQAQAVVDGDLTRAEALLMVQAHSLDAIYNNLAQRAINAEYINNLDHYLRLALKAQAQCRTTLQTLVEVKYPKQATFIRQANIAEQQQVNNGVSSESRAGEIPKNATNELLEDSSHEAKGIRMDDGAASKAGCDDQELASVGDLDRSTDNCG